MNETPSKRTAKLTGRQSDPDTSWCRSGMYEGRNRSPKGNMEEWGGDSGYPCVDPGNELPRPTVCCHQKCVFELGTLQKHGGIIHEQASTDGGVFWEVVSSTLNLAISRESVIYTNPQSFFSQTINPFSLFTQRQTTTDRRLRHLMRLFRLIQVTLPTDINSQDSDTKLDMGRRVS
ncbi:hypothetical protein TNCV_740901 [Trichonephila clavipes]|nr:hypothetical protein TNCV_740901 [Trichonephila clavipes]